MTLFCNSNPKVWCVIAEAEKKKKKNLKPLNENIRLVYILFSNSLYFNRPNKLSAQESTGKSLSC